VAVATAVLTGALLVGDSVRGSLRDLAVERLGRIDFAVLSNGLFRSELASELADDNGFRKLKSLDAVAPALLLQGALESGGGSGDVRRAGDVSVVGNYRPLLGIWSGRSGGAAAGRLAGPQRVACPGIGY
jgi:hypothetical protein